MLLDSYEKQSHTAFVRLIEQARTGSAVARTGAPTSVSPPCARHRNRAHLDNIGKPFLSRAARLMTRPSPFMVIVGGALSISPRTQSALIDRRVPLFRKSWRRSRRLHALLLCSEVNV